jgi:serine/threonine-protein kinase RsbW
LAVAPTITLRAQIPELVRLYEWLQSLAERERFSSRLLFKIDLCLSELATNVISYGYASRPAPEEALTVGYQRTATDAIFEIVDHGVPFDPTHYVPAPPAASRKEAEVGGRGLRLVQHYVGSMQHRRQGSDNHLTLIFPLGEA